jgi:hypothetical protein
MEKTSKQDMMVEDSVFCKLCSSKAGIIQHDILHHERSISIVDRKEIKLKCLCGGEGSLHLSEGYTFVPAENVVIFN